MIDIVNKYFEELSLLLFYIAFFGLSEMYVKYKKFTKTQQVIYYLSLLFIAFGLMLFSF
tara:strand:- start:152 stop:328 length:177 start_codon:yes stop_codon:yes gene_type:complete